MLAPVLVFERAGIQFYLTVLSPRDQRLQLKASPAGKPIGRIALPERCANVCFGGRNRDRLFMAASHSVYALYVNTQGALGG